MNPWPRRLINYPIILIAVAQQIIVGVCLMITPDTVMVTAVHSLYHIVVSDPEWLGFIMIDAALLAALGFMCQRKVNTLMCLLPQQLLLYIAAGGSVNAILHGAYADGVVRSSAFLLADQVSTALIAIFHTWGMLLILVYGEDKEGASWFGH